MNEISQYPKTVLITGAARRIGAAIASKFHQQGYQLVLHCHRALEEANALAANFNAERADSAIVVRADLTNLAEVNSLAELSLKKFPAIHVLVNNASGFYPSPFGKVDSSQWEDLLGSNLKGSYFLSQLLADALRKNGGCIINIADIHAKRPLRNHSVYSIAKAGLLAMTKSLAVELAPEVRVNAVSPGTILWPEKSAMSEATKQAIIARIPLARTGAPQDIAEAVWFLATRASYLTGATIRVDGGRHLNL